MQSDLLKVRSTEDFQYTFWQLLSTWMLVTDVEDGCQQQKIFDKFHPPVLSPKTAYTFIPWLSRKCLNMVITDCWQKPSPTSVANRFFWGMYKIAGSKATYVLETLRQIETNSYISSQVFIPVWKSSKQCLTLTVIGSWFDMMCILWFH